MVVRITSEEKPQTGPKKAGRPPGSRDKEPRPSTLVKKKSEDRVAKDLERAHVIAQRIQATADLTDDELIEKARNAPPMVVGGSIAITPEKAERIALAYRLQSRGLSVAQISQQMNISTITAEAYLKEVRNSLKLDPKNLDVGYYMGESLAFFQEIRQMALMQASAASNSAGIKLTAMRTAIEAERSKNEFLTKIGLYSPTVVERLERWIIGSAMGISDAPQIIEQVNIAAEIGRVMARRTSEARHSDSQIIEG